MSPPENERSPEHYEQFTDPVDGTRWRIDVGFIDSNWTCIWGRGCEGILDHRAAELNQGCCSVGAHLVDDDEAMLISALGLSLDPARFQYHAAAVEQGVLAAGDQPATRVVDDACIFFNRPGFAGGEGCALHLAALDEGESPIDWKPSICWQAPMKVDHHDDGSRTLRPWGRGDWGPDEDLAWCCTESNATSASGPSAFVGQVSVSESLHAELTGLVGPEIAVELRARSAADPEGS
ncbi:MAG: hypothetical protein ACR2QK_11720 [Acidimicrobiales bacterium]